MRGQVDIINSTLGKAMGGATGGYTTSRHPEVVQALRQVPWLGEIASCVCAYIQCYLSLHLTERSSELCWSAKLLSRQVVAILQLTTQLAVDNLAYREHRPILPSFKRLRSQRSRPYLFSNTLAPPVVAASLAVFDLLEGSTALRDKLSDNTAYFRGRMAAEGFRLAGDPSHPIVPIMLGDAALAVKMARLMLERGIYVVSCSSIDRAVLQNTLCCAGCVPGCSAERRVGWDARFAIEDARQTCILH